MRQILQVLTPPVSTSMTTLDALRSEVDSSDPSFYVRGPSLIQQASRMIQQYVGRDFARQQVRETFTRHVWTNTPRYHDSILLALRPVVSIDATNAELTDYDLDSYQGIIYPTSPYWTRTTVITYTAGYLMPGQDGSNFPEDLQRACIETVVSLWYAPDRGDPNIMRESTDGVGMTIYALHPTAFTPFTAAILDNYKAMR